MICPSCHAAIADDAVECPQCHTPVEPAARVTSFLYCDGCGARLTPQDRTCPKCGRPAPGILSSESSASDLAAGKTASFPKIAHGGIETEIPYVSPVANVRSVLDDALDPHATTVLDARDISASAMRPVDSPKRRVPKGLIITLVIVLFAICAWAFVVFDPFGVIPGFVESIDSSAGEMFPSRQQAEEPAPESSSQGADDGDEASEPAAPLEDAALSDEAAFEELHQAYENVVAINDGERFAGAIESFNASYLDPDIETRRSASADAYELRDELQAIIDDLDAMKLSNGSAYEEDREHVRQLAEWMYERVDAICASWDVSLSVPEGEYPFEHEDEILAPMREAGSSALDSYYANVLDWEPQEH